MVPEQGPHHQDTPLLARLRHERFSRRYGETQRLLDEYILSPPQGPTDKLSGGPRGRRNGHGIYGGVAQPLVVGRDGSTVGVALPPLVEALILGIADHGERLELVEVPNEVSTPVARPDHRHPRSSGHLLHVLIAESSPRLDTRV